MKHSYRGAAFASVLAVVALSIGSTPSAIAATTYTMGSSEEIPAARGKVRLRNTKNGNVEIKLSVQHLAPPGRIVPGAQVFVVWVRGLAPGSVAQNLGALIVDKNLNGKLKAVTAMPSFDLFMTCEQSQTASVPASLELLAVHYSSP
jgi:hypothetical protein